MQKVLIIMEPDSLRDALSKELRQSFEVITCNNADDGTALLQNKPDVMVLDLFLPRTDGLTFLIRNKSHLPPVVVVISALTTHEVLRHLADLGVTAVIRRPCTVEAITTALKICI